MSSSSTRARSSQEALAVHPGNQLTLPLVSVIVRSMGRPELRLALESIARQDYPNVEIIVVDATGGSHPTLPVIAWQSGHSIRIVGGHRRLMRPHAANEGLQAVHGEWFCFLDDDDTYDPDFLSAMLNASREHPETLLVYGRARMLDKNGNVEKLFGCPFNRSLMYYGPLFYWQAAIIRRKVIELGCHFDEALEVCEDRDFLYQIAEHSDFVFVPVTGFNYRPDLGTSGTAYPDDPSALHGLARLALHDGQLDAAEKWARRAIEINPSAAEFCMTIALILEASHKYEEALSFVWRAAINPTFQAGAYALARRLPATVRATLPAETSATSVHRMNDKPQELGHAQEIEKFLLCRPIGGLNDTLCQIEKCWRYAEKYSRSLIIDTLKSGLLAEFSEFFSARTSLTKVYFRLTEAQLCMLNTLTCFPHSVQGKIKTYFSVYSKDSGNYIDRETSTILTFDFNKNYDEIVLVHEQCGGGNLSFNLLNRVSISEKIRPIILEKIQELDHDYLAIHVRNTDYQTKFEDLFKDIYPKVSDKSLLVCSDDAEVISRAKSFFTSSKILISSHPTQTEKKPLHHSTTHHDDEQRKKATINSIIDLIALGRSTELYFSNVTAGHPSGFSRLAMHLCENKNVIDALLKLATSAPTSASLGRPLQYVSRYSTRWN
jgi:tetratricopeptide (TPR) repeat protein